MRDPRRALAWILHGRAEAEAASNTYAALMRAGGELPAFLAEPTTAEVYAEHIQAVEETCEVHEVASGLAEVRAQVSWLPATGGPRPVMSKRLLADPTQALHLAPGDPPAELLFDGSGAASGIGLLAWQPKGDSPRSVRWRFVARAGRLDRSVNGKQVGRFELGVGSAVRFSIVDPGYVYGELPAPGAYGNASRSASPPARRTCATATLRCQSTGPGRPCSRACAGGSARCCRRGSTCPTRARCAPSTPSSSSRASRSRSPRGSRC